MGHLKAGESLYKPPPLLQAMMFKSNTNTITITKTITKLAQKQI